MSSSITVNNADGKARLRSRGPWVEVDLGVLDDNIRRARFSLTPDTELMMVVKADAYGHGTTPVVRRAWEAGVRRFAVAYLDEALPIREALPEAWILVMGVVDPGYVPDLLEHRIVPVVVSEEHGLALGRAAFELDKNLPVHVKIDSGMGRLGVLWNRADDVMARLRLAPGLRLEGVCSHFATVEPERPELAGRQMTRMQQLQVFQDRTLLRHVSSSRAFLFHSEWDFDAVRTGISLYGYGSREPGMRVHTRPVLSWKTRVIQVKSVPEDFPVGYYSAYRTTTPTDLATIAVGYADGYHRLLSNRGHVLIRGQRRRVVGRVSMNWITVDAGMDSGITAGDEVVLIGQQGSEAVWADEIARHCSTIAYEVLTSIPAVNERVYVDSADGASAL